MRLSSTFLLSFDSFVHPFFEFLKHKVLNRNLVSPKVFLHWTWFCCRVQVSLFYLVSQYFNWVFQTKPIQHFPSHLTVWLEAIIRTKEEREKRWRQTKKNIQHFSQKKKECMKLFHLLRYCRSFSRLTQSLDNELIYSLLWRKISHAKITWYYSNFVAFPAEPWVKISSSS